MTERDPIDRLDSLLRQPDRPAAPSPAFARRLRERIAAELAPEVFPKGDDPMLPHAPALPVALPTPARREPTGRPRSWMRAVEVAAVLVLMIGAVGGYVAGGRFWVGQPGGAPEGTPTGGDDGPAAMWGGDAGRTGTQPGPGPDGTVGIRWQVVDDAEYGSYGFAPVALDGRFYRMGYERDPSTQALVSTFLEALDVETGRRLWQAPLNNVGAPSATDEMVYVSVLSEGWTDDLRARPSALVALDAASGREVWRVDTGDSTGGFATSPIVIDGTVYVSDPDGTVYAVDAASGAKRWTSTAARPDTAPPDSEFLPHGATGTLAVGNGVIYVGNSRGVLFALDSVTGDVQWSVNVLDRFRMRSGRIMPITVEGAVLVEIAATDASTGNPEFPSVVAALDAEAGTGFWNRRFSELLGDVAVAHGLVLVPTAGDDRSVLTALDLKTGETRWEQDLSGSGFMVPSVAGGIAYVGTGDGSIYALDVDSGEKRWRVAPTRVFPRYPPAVADGAVFVVDDAGTVSAIAAVGGATPIAP